MWVSAPLLVSGTALAQAEMGSQAGVDVSAPSGQAAQDGAGPAAAPEGVLIVPYGLPSAGADVNDGSPSGSRSTADTNAPRTSFDLSPSSGASVVRGRADGDVVLEPTSSSSPEIHTVKRGDTLWSISDLHFSSPWAWPKVWSMNPEIQNPHWIYPGDHVRLRAASRTAQQSPRTTMTIGTGTVTLRKAEVPAQTIFLRDRGYIADQVKDIWGEIGGSPSEQMLLSYNSDVYLEIKKGQEVTVGQELTIFRPLRSVSADEKGTIVAILGTARVNRWDPKTRVARAKITESLDVIERGAKVGPVGRSFDIVPPQASEVDVWAKITASLYPHVFYGQEQVVFIDKGAKDGLQPGNRLFAVAKGDQWKRSLSVASEYAALRPDDEGLGVEDARGSGRDEDYPEEVIGEIRVLRVRDNTATCLVTSSSRELEPGFQVVSRKGY